MGLFLYYASRKRAIKLMKKIYSPLRYPGSKAKVLAFMKDLIKKNFKEKKPCYIEPYAGGAAVALGLLLEDVVSDIYINDNDIAIYSFWEYCIRRHPTKLINKIRNVKVTIDEWEKQACIYADTKKKEGFELGFAAFFLNRCNHSGIIKGGPIGGHTQTGQYRLDCRFNKTELINRINAIAKRRKNIHVFKDDTKDFLLRKDLHNVLCDCLLYLDPPYYKKGSQLYKNFYIHKDHEEISKIMQKLNVRWVISYDNQPEIRKFYAGLKKREFNLTYYAGHKTVKREKNGKEIMFFSNRIKKIPPMSLIDK